MLMRDGAVQFISSGDARAQSKLGRTGKQWPLELGESYVLGNVATSDTGSRFQQGVDIFVPDSFLSSRHAVLFSKEGRYFIARHPDAGGAAGIAKFILRVRGKTVTTSQELHESDDILVGRTALRFSSKKLHD
jgi:pSer/pThr/pTyr-binding forkhead associated (FHA) protein